MKIVLDLNDVGDYHVDTIKEWLFELFKNELIESKGAISNEEIWVNGSSDEEDIKRHNDNIECYKEYIDILEDAISQT